MPDLRDRRTIVGTVLTVLVLVWQRLNSDAAPGHAPGFLDCGPAVSLCGVLTLQTGLGHGVYNSPGVHGLWPQTSGHGSSVCIRPSATFAANKVYDCYQVPGRSTKDILQFQRHEFEKHGRCAGVRDAADYFTQTCRLAAAPLDVIKASRRVGKGLADIADALRAHGFPVWEVAPAHAEVLLSACADRSGQWKLARREEFAAVCAAHAPSIQADQKLQAAQAAGTKEQQAAPTGGDIAQGGGGFRACVRGRRGPRCETNAECAGVSGCLRCARSGFCTDVPM